jgi:hypothetical protein
VLFSENPGAEMAFGNFFHTLHSGDYKALEPMLSAQLFETFPTENESSDLLQGVAHADTGGYELEKVLIQGFDPKEMEIDGQVKKVLLVGVKFMCTSHVDVAVGGETMLVKPLEPPERTSIILSFTSPLPWEIPGAKDTIGATDFAWRITTIDTTNVRYLDEE